MRFEPPCVMRTTTSTPRPRNSANNQRAGNPRSITATSPGRKCSANCWAPTRSPRPLGRSTKSSGSRRIRSIATTVSACGQWLANQELFLASFNRRLVSSERGATRRSPSIPMNRRPLGWRNRLGVIASSRADTCRRIDRQTSRSSFLRDSLKLDKLGRRSQDRKAAVSAKNVLSISR